MGGMSRLSDEISPNEVSVAICTAREPGTLKRGPKKGRKAKKGLKTKGSKKKSGWKLLRNKFRPLDYCNEIKKKSGWKLLKSKVRPLKKKKRIAKKKMGAVVKFKKGAKTAKRKRARKRLEKMLDEENIEALAREILSAKTRLKEIQAADNSSKPVLKRSTESVPLTPPPPSAAAKQLSYDETWAEFRSIIYSMLRTTDPDTIPETILDNLDMKDVTNRMWKRTRDLLVKMVDGKSNPFSMLRPEAGDSAERREFFSSLEQGKVSPFEDLTFGSLLNLDGLRSTDNENFSGYAPRWENAVWKLTKAICESWDYDPVLKVLSKGQA